MANNNRELLDAFLSSRRVCDQWEEIFYDIVPEEFQPEFRILKTKLQTNVNSLTDTLRELINVVESSSHDFQEARDKILAKLENCEHRALKDKILGLKLPSPFKTLWHGFPKFTDNFFFGRAKELNRLRELFDSNHPEIVICGLTGMGKSALVSNFLTNYKENPVLNVAWLKCETDSDFLASCISLMKAVHSDYGIKSGITSNSIRADTVIPALIEICKELYEKLQNKLTLVLDSCNEGVASRFVSSKFQEKCNKFVRLIFISRSQHACLGNVANYTIKVKSMDPKDSLRYITSLLGVADHEDNSSLEELCAEYYHYPVVLKHAAAIILEQMRSVYTLERPQDAVIKFLKTKNQGIKNTPLRNADYADHELTTCFTNILGITINEIKSKKTTPYALPLLQIMVYVKPSQLSYNLLWDIFSSQKGEIDPAKFDESLGMLKSLDLINVTEYDPEKVIEVNVLAQNPNVCDPDESGLKVVEKFLHNVDKKVEGFQAREMRQVIEVFSHVMKTRKEMVLEWMFATALQLIAQLDNLQMRYEILEFSEMLYKQNWSLTQTPKALELYSRFAASLEEFGRLDEALNVNLEVYRVYCESEPEGKVSKIALDRLHEIAGIYLHKEDYAKALKIYEEVLQGREPQYPEYNQKILAPKANIANAYIKLAKFEPAKKILKEVISTQKANGLLNESLESTRTLGRCFFMEKDYPRAKEHFEEAAKISSPRLRVVAEFNLGRTLLHLGMIEEGLKLLGEVGQKQREWYGDKHPDTQKTVQLMREFDPEPGTCPDQEKVGPEISEEAVQVDRNVQYLRSESAHVLMEGVSSKTPQSREEFLEEKRRLIRKYNEVEDALQREIYLNRKRKNEELMNLFDIYKREV